MHVLAMHDPSKEITIAANEQARMSWFISIYSSQYLMVKCEYESKRKKWKVFSNRSNWFTLKDSNNVESHVYFSNSIKNCDCDSFVQDETGVCQHTYVIDNNKQLFRKSIERDGSLIYVSYPEGLVKTGKGKLDSLDLSAANLWIKKTRADNPYAEFSPAVAKYVARQQRQQHVPFIVDLGEFHLLKKYGITLYDHQKTSISQMLSGRRTILTLKMGLGKTICALYCCRVLSKAKKVIIICPNSLKFQWKKEIDRFELGTSIVISKGTDLENYTDQKFLILSYEMLNRHHDLLASPFDIAIIDEIQKIKNGESKSWETIHKLQAQFIFSLSGTPIQNSITDLISILKVISPKEFSPDWKFYETYCILSKTRLSGWNNANLGKLREKLTQYIINPKINWENFKLPTKTMHTIDCTMDNLQVKAHDSALEAAKLLLSKSARYPLNFHEKARLNSLLLQCRRAVSDGRLLQPNGPKSDRFRKIEELLVKKVSEGKKVIVYSDWIDCLKLLIPELDRAKIGYALFTGELSDKAKSKNLELFITDPATKVFLSTDSGGLGIDGLQLASHTIVHVEDIWNPMKLSQRDGRVVRALQEAPNVDVYHFDSKSGIENMLQLNKIGKNQIINDVLS